MPRLTLAEAASRSGFSIEFLESLFEHCPKSGEERVLRRTVIEGEVLIDQDELDDYRKYLRQPWPTTASGNRPRVPDYIARDVKDECHYMCALCGAMDNGEVAHIEAVATTLNNSPDNLILLCPNHHTEYDYGYRPSSNVDIKVIRAAKEMKRASRRRVLRHEANAVRAMRTLLKALQQTLAKVAAEDDPDMRQALTTEIESLVQGVPELSAAAEEASKRDADFDEAEQALAEIAPQLAKLGTRAAADESDTRSAARSIVEAAAPLLDFDEVDCPRCGGRGTTGLVGDMCAYCGGSCFVSQTDADDYDENDIDEVDCPRCGGRGTTGLVGDICRLCQGSCVVSKAIAVAYDTSHD